MPLAMRRTTMVDRHGENAMMIALEYRELDFGRWELNIYNEKMRMISFGGDMASPLPNEAMQLLREIAPEHNILQWYAAIDVPNRDLIK